MIRRPRRTAISQLDHLKWAPLPAGATERNAVPRVPTAMVSRDVTARLSWSTVAQLIRTLSSNSPDGWATRRDEENRCAGCNDARFATCAMRVVIACG